MIADLHRGSRRWLKRLRRGCRVFMNGEDVSARCFYADDRNGVVRLYKLNANGHKYVRGTKGDPEWRPEWPEHRMYCHDESGNLVELKPFHGFGEAATEERRGRVRIELAR